MLWSVREFMKDLPGSKGYVEKVMIQIPGS